jgi:hypothetical protein
MIRKVAFAALLFANPVMAQTANPWLDWVAANSPHGFDVTPDGTIWINLSEVGKTDDYAIRAEDLRDATEARNRKPSFWVRGYHKRNPKVRYRQTKARLTLDCEHETLETSTTAYYDADGNLLWRTGYTPTEYIIPGTYGAEYRRLFCAL